MPPAAATIYRRLVSGTERDDPGPQRRGGGLWDAVDDIEHVVGQTEPATLPDIPAVRSAPPRDVSPDSDRDGTPIPEPDVSPRFTRARLLVGLALLVLAIAAIAALTVTRSTGPVTLPLPSGMTAPGGAGVTPGPGGGPAPSGPGVASPNPPNSAGVPAGPSASPPGTPPPSTPAPEPVPLAARYATVGQNVLGLSGYTGQVRISNPGSGVVSGWQVVITLPDGATVADTSGAQARPSQGTVTFTPTDATRDVNGGGTVEFTFDVTGLLAGPPTGCAIDGRPCD
jgi:hypothetical protein